MVRENKVKAMPIYYCLTFVLPALSSQLSVISKLCIMNTLLQFLLLLCQSCHCLRSVSFGGRILGLIKVLITVGWVWWRHQRGPLFSLPTRFGSLEFQIGSQAFNAHAGRLVAGTLLAITRQLLQLEKCSNPISKSSSSEWKFFFQFWVWGSLGGRHKWGCFSIFMAYFSRPWTPIEWAHILAR